MAFELLDVAEDDDGIPVDQDLCPGTRIPERVPLIQLRANHYALVTGDTVFDTARDWAGWPPHWTGEQSHAAAHDRRYEGLQLRAGSWMSDFQETNLYNYGCPFGILQGFIASHQ